MTAFVNLVVHGRYVDCCLTVHGPGLRDNKRLFLAQQRKREGGRERGEWGSETEKWLRRTGMESRGRKKEGREREIALTIVQF